jgi:2'-5' RNA ligase superfamily
MPRTALIVPVPEADEHYTGPPGVTAHVTVLVPFVDGPAVDESEVASVLAPVPAFDFVLDRVERFADGTRWLHPEPSEPFRALTRLVWRRWPDHPPYEGLHADVIPHVTITVEDVSVPIVARAREVLLIEEAADGSWAVRRRFPLAWD